MKSKASAARGVRSPPRARRGNSSTEKQRRAALEVLKKFRQIFRAAKLHGKVSERNSILVTSSGLKELTFLFSPTLVHLDDPTLSIKVNAKQVHRGKLEPDLDTLVRELRRTGDRKALVVKKLTARL